MIGWSYYRTKGEAKAAGGAEQVGGRRQQLV